MILSAFWLIGCVATQQPTPQPAGPQPVAVAAADHYKGRALQILSQMTLDEKIDLISGVDGFNIRGVPRLGVPKVILSDGPVGIRNFGPTTAYPAGVCLAASFNPELAREFGEAIGNDAQSKGVSVWLGPGVNLSRVPQNGRNFEYLGEDPYLASKMVAHIVQGVQSKGVVATVKHFATNNHEDDRMQDSSDVDERVLRELYLKPFEAAVKEGGALAVMCAYNKLNGTYCAENPFLLTDVLKKDWGFNGLVMSDWGAVHSTLPTIKAGLDLEMPEGDFLNRTTIKPLMDSGQVSLNDIDDKVYRILRVALWTMDTKGQNHNPDPGASEATALKIAREGTVLLKNRDQILPLQAKRLHHILVVGPNADPAITGGGGSSFTTPAISVSLLQAIRNVAGPNVQVDYKPITMDSSDKAIDFHGYTLPDNSGAPGLKLQRFNNMTLSGDPVETKTEPRVRMVRRSDQNPPLHFSLRWTGNVQFNETGDYDAISRSDDGIRVFLDDQPLIDDWNDHGEKVDAVGIHVKKGQVYRLRVEYYQNEGDAIATFGFVSHADTWMKDLPIHEIQNADAVIASVGFNPAIESEGVDRSFALPNEQSEMVQKVASLNPRTIVVNNSGAGVDMMPWAKESAAIIQGWYPGGSGSTAIAEIMFGLVNPSGKLPTTFPKSLKGTYYETAYPPVDHHVAYNEGLLIGYRWFDTNHVDPLFPFGFGLSYTRFNLSDFKFGVDKESRAMHLKVTVQNTGTVDGAETVQAYVHEGHSQMVRPEKELKGFRKVFLRPGERKEVEIPIQIADLAHFDVPHHRWAIESGRYEVLVGTSSRNLPIHYAINLKGVNPKQ